MSVNHPAAAPLNHAEGDVDKIVDERFFAGREHGVVVEIGAARPDYLSVGARFRDRGWRVLAIEPNPAYRPHYARLGLEMLEYACGEKDENDVDFTVVNSHGTAYCGGGVTFESWSSLAVKEQYASLKPDLDLSTIKVQVRRLDTILRQHAPDVDGIDLISVDVEGWELEALSGLSFDRYQPCVLVVENLFYDRSYPEFMSARGYVLWKHIHPNDVYVRSTALSKREAYFAPLRTSFLSAVERSHQWLSRALRA